MGRRARSEYRSNMGSLCVTNKGQAIHVASPSRTELTVRSRILVCSEGISAREPTIDGRYVDPPGGTAAVQFPVLAFTAIIGKDNAFTTCRGGAPSITIGLMSDFILQDGAAGKRRFEELLANRFPEIAG